MKIVFASVACAMLVATSWGQITYPYNPDADGDNFIGVSDILEGVANYDTDFHPGAILVDSLELTEVLDSLQSQITALQNESGDAFRCGDDVLHEGSWYNTTSIGAQCWFSENVRYLPEVSPSIEVSYEMPLAYVYDYEGNQVDEAKTTLNYHQFGVLYNFPAVQQWDLCPNGWHVPTDEEWTAMTSSLGSENFAGTMMKANFLWSGTNLNGLTNMSGFSGLPGGIHTQWGGYSHAGNLGYWWSSSDLGGGIPVAYAWCRYLSDFDMSQSVYRDYGNSEDGFSVRCVRDAE